MTNLYKYFIPFMPLLMAGVMLNIVSMITVIIVFIAYFLICITRHEKAVVCSFILCKLLGFFFSFIGIPIQGSVVALVIMLICLGGDVFKLFDTKYIKPALFIISTYLILVGFFLLTGNTDNSSSKIYRTLVSLLFDSLGFMLLVQFSDINLRRVSPMLFLESLILIAFPVQTFELIQFQGLFDFDSYRELFYELKKMDIFILTYHTVGISSFIAAVFYLSDKNRLSSALDYIMIFTCAWMILVSGARQAAFGFIFFFALWFLFKYGYLKLSTMLFATIFIIGAISVIQMLDIEAFSNVFESGNDIDETLGRNYEYPLQLIDDNLAFGVGFGNYYNPQSEEIYPHNIILELFCELGLIGTFIFLIPTIIYFGLGNANLGKTLKNGSMCIYILFPFLVRAMISADLCENIALFCGIFILFLRYDDEDEETTAEDEDPEAIDATTPIIIEN